jgi:hypothetical protein
MSAASPTFPPISPAVFTPSLFKKLPIFAPIFCPIACPFAKESLLLFLGSCT